MPSAPDMTRSTMTSEIESVAAGKLTSSAPTVWSSYPPHQNPPPPNEPLARKIWVRGGLDAGNKVAVMVGERFMRQVALWVLFALSVALPARAEPEFPAAIRQAANIPCAPPCTLCHTESPGTAANPTRPFAHTVLTSGLVPNHPESLKDVVTALRENKTDTDHDGRLDIDELASGTDPSDPKESAELCGPTYGCGAHVASVTPSGLDQVACGAAVALALALFGHTRRRRSTKARH
jgi:MYXO-CTERM domain-containing protein